MKMAGKVLLLILVLTTIGCDRVTKHLATTSLAGAPPQSYFADTLRFEYAENTGAFLSLGADLPAWVRTTIFTLGVGLTLTLLALVGLKRHWAGLRFVGAALMWAGGTSNLVDRAARGSVVDFFPAKRPKDRPASSLDFFLACCGWWTRKQLDICHSKE